VNRYTKIVDHFDATHRDPDESSHVHGHRFTIEVVEQSEVPTPIVDDLAAICMELHLRDLEQMLVGGSQSLTGIASWFMERLLTKHPRVVNVEVWYDDFHRAGISRTVR
jgi:hypothetical protein